MLQWNLCRHDGAVVSKNLATPLRGKAARYLTYRDIPSDVTKRVQMSCVIVPRILPLSLRH